MDKLISIALEKMLVVLEVSAINRNTSKFRCLTAKKEGWERGKKNGIGVIFLLSWIKAKPSAADSIRTRTFTFNQVSSKALIASSRSFIFHLLACLDAGTVKKRSFFYLLTRTGVSPRLCDCESSRYLQYLGTENNNLIRTSKLVPWPIRQ